MAVVVQPELHGRGADNARGVAVPGAARWWRHVTVSSVNACLPDPGIIDYCAAKAALTNFSKAMSKELGPKGIAREHGEARPGSSTRTARGSEHAACPATFAHRIAASTSIQQSAQVSPIAGRGPRTGGSEPVGDERGRDLLRACPARRPSGNLKDAHFDRRAGLIEVLRRATSSKQANSGRNFCACVNARAIRACPRRQSENPDSSRCARWRPPVLQTQALPAPGRRAPPMRRRPRSQARPDRPRR